MENISDIKIEPLQKSQYVKPYRMHFKQNGVRRIWDLITLHESVFIVIFNTERRKLVCVKQFRPAVYCNELAKEDGGLEERNYEDASISGAEGCTLEWCAGIVDKNIDVKEIAQAEVLEECGYKVPISKFEKIISCRAGVGVSGEMQTGFYVEVDDSMKVSEGGGLASEGEMIDVIELSIEDAKKMLERPFVNSPSGHLKMHLAL
ncbi:Uridine diphosphate glucose pyrophosphatase [Armadillidium nasatum]|uniref:Uridine diphosphate glucose pyrophosphatase NUDT14 n=1 Tax=Armadillidium nasatum TaxID=96803 RepID=A0A5N5TDS2_9CRUS|nr:Uridine diphosphate glucose pyrophosphatase [Armadillidium nasatum]